MLRAEAIDRFRNRCARTAAHIAECLHTINGFDGSSLDKGDKNGASVMTRDVDGAALAAGILGASNRTFLVPAVLAKVLESGDDAVKLFRQLQTPRTAPPRCRCRSSRGTEGLAGHRIHPGVRPHRVSGVVTRLMPEAHRDEDRSERLGSAGQLIPGAEVRVVDPDTLDEVPAGGQVSCGSARRS